MLNYPITAALSPNTEKEDVIRAIRALISPNIWTGRESLKRVTDWFRAKYKTRYVYPVNSGRSALYLLLKAFGIGQGDEVLLQAFTCVAVPNSIRWTGAKPVYVDIDKTYNIDVRDFVHKITKHTKAVIVQHTFGYPADVLAIRKICNKRKIFLIEDCAHALGTTIHDALAGSYGDAAFFSFGRDKVISSVFGGLALFSEYNSTEARKFETNFPQVAKPKTFWVLQQVLHPILFALILPLYSLGIGKVLLVVFQKLGILSFPVYPEEKRGEQPADFPATYHNVLAYLLELQLKKIDRYIIQRQKIARYYSDQLEGNRAISFPVLHKQAGYLRFPLSVTDPGRIMFAGRKHNVLFGNWYQHVVDPKGVQNSCIEYTQGTCPRAEDMVKKVVNLPTLISDQAAERVIAIVQEQIT